MKACDISRRRAGFTQAKLQSCGINTSRTRRKEATSIWHCIFPKGTTRSVPLGGSLTDSRRNPIYQRGHDFIIMTSRNPDEMG